jgi:hypothetical protein
MNDTGPKYGKLFREAKEDSQRDYYHLHRELMIEGYWRIRSGHGTPWIPARTYWSDAEPGNPGNLLDRWPLPILVGEIAGEPVDPLDIFGLAGGKREELVPQDGLTVEEEYRYQTAVLLHRETYTPNHPLGQRRRRINLIKMEPIY